jgi:hypothetical protein
MNRTLSLQELAIVVSTPSQNPSVINLEFLKYSGIVPMEWELARAPINTNQVSQIVFANGVAIAAQPDRVMFLGDFRLRKYRYLRANPNIPLR